MLADLFHVSLMLLEACKAMFFPQSLKKFKGKIIFHVFDYIVFGNIPLARVSYMAKPNTSESRKVYCA